LLHQAVLENNIHKVSQILMNGIDINQLDEIEGSGFCVPSSALHIAVNKDYVEMVMFLLEHGAKVNVEQNGGKTPIFYAKSLVVAKNLVECGANIEAYCKIDMYNPLLLKLWMNHLEVADYLLYLGSQPKHWAPRLLQTKAEKYYELLLKYETQFSGYFKEVFEEVKKKKQSLH